MHNGVKWVNVVTEFSVMAKKETIKKRFRSRSEHTLDQKGRLNFPSRFRQVMQTYDSNDLMITVWGDHLRAFPLAEWERLEDKLLTQGREQPGLASFVRMVVSGITECSLDKQGRLLIPVSLRNELKIEREVILTGMLDWVEIWDKDRWLVENQAARDNFDSFEDSLAKLGIF